MRKIPDDLRDLLTEAPDDGKTKASHASKAIAAVIGAVVGAGAGLLLFVVFGLLGGNGQAGLAAVIIGIPAGAWIGAEIGARQA